MHLPLNVRILGCSGGVTIKGKDSGALQVRRNDAKDAQVYGTLRDQVRGSPARKRQITLEFKRCARAANLGGLQRNDRVRVIRSDGTCRLDLQRLIAGVKCRDGQVSFELRLILKRALQ